jgi:hypothetical protein
MTDLLARLRSPSMIVSSTVMLPPKWEALCHAVDSRPDGIQLTRRRGEDLPKGWQEIWELVEAGYLENSMTVRDPATGVVDYTFKATSSGVTRWSEGSGDLTPPPPREPKKPRRKRGAKVHNEHTKSV